MKCFSIDWFIGEEDSLMLEEGGLDEVGALALRIYPTLRRI